jgi:Sulfotransferase domain
MLVNFVVGGTQKGGTSALDLFLRQHPEICMPETKKELHYFDKEENFARRPNYKKYHAHFSPGPHHRVVGEATPSYMYWRATPYRIWSYNPQMKWILVLRNPVARAFSAWNMERNRGVEHLSFEEAIQQEAKRCREALPFQHRTFSYLDRGFYAHQIRRLFNIFGEQNCLVVLNEELRTNHQNTLKKVFDFLRVDTLFTPAQASVFEHDYDERIDFPLFGKLTKVFYFDIKEVERLLGRDLSRWYET